MHSFDFFETKTTTAAQETQHHQQHHEEASSCWDSDLLLCPGPLHHQGQRSYRYYSSTTIPRKVLREGCHHDDNTVSFLTQPKGAYTTKSVRFKKNARGRKYLHIDDYTRQEVSSCWYHQSHFARMKTEAKHIADGTTSRLDKRESGEDLLVGGRETSLVHDYNLCIRGTERYNKENLKRREEEREEALKLVLGYQRDGKVDLARAYEEVSSSARTRARVQALKDELDTLAL